MASISKRAGGKYRARYRDESGKEHAKHFGRKVDAQRWLDEVTASVVTGNYVDPKAGRLTFATYFAEWSLQQVWASGTLISAEQAADSVTFAHTPMRAIRPSHVQQWVKAMSLPAKSRSTRLAPSTIRTRFNYVHMAFRAAVEDRIIQSDPSARVSLPKVRRAEAAMTIPTPEEMARILAACSPSFRPFVAVCAFAGLRLGEAAGVRVTDVDFLRRTITVGRQVQGQTRGDVDVVAPKHGSERVVYVPEELTTMLAEQVVRGGAWGEEQWLFGSSGHLLNRNSAGNQWRRARERAGVTESFTLHDCRHFFASGLIASGCDVVTVQRALGHSSPTITLSVYAHLWPNAEDRTRAAAADLMASVLGTPADSPRTAVR